MSSYYPLEIPRCEHIKDNGVRCGGPALRGKSFCYHHDDVHAKRLTPGQKGYKIRPLETGESVTMQVAEIAQAAHDGKISLQLARLLLYSIQIGAQQLKNLGASAGYFETEVTPAMEEVKHQNIGPSEHLDIGTAEEESGAVGEPIGNHESLIDNPTTTESVTGEHAGRFIGLSDDQITRPPDALIPRCSDDQMKKRPRYYDPEGCLAFLTGEAK